MRYIFTLDWIRHRLVM